MAKLIMPDETWLSRDDSLTIAYTKGVYDERDKWKKKIDEIIEEIQQKHVHCFERIDFDTAYGLNCALNIIKKYCDKEQEDGNDD